MRPPTPQVEGLGAAVVLDFLRKVELRATVGLRDFRILVEGPSPARYDSRRVV